MARSERPRQQPETARKTKPASAGAYQKPRVTKGPQLGSFTAGQPKGGGSTIS